LKCITGDLHDLRLDAIEAWARRLNDRFVVIDLRNHEPSGRAISKRRQGQARQFVECASHAACANAVLPLCQTLQIIRIDRTLMPKRVAQLRRVDRDAVDGKQGRKCDQAAFVGRCAVSRNG
jgi:hypothetical protein